MTVPRFSPGSIPPRFVPTSCELRAITLACLASVVFLTRISARLPACCTRALFWGASLGRGFVAIKINSIYIYNINCAAGTSSKHLRRMCLLRMTSGCRQREAVLPMPVLPCLCLFNSLKRALSSQFALPALRHAQTCTRN